MRVINIVGKVTKDDEVYKVGKSTLTMEDILKMHEGKAIEIDISIVEKD